MGALLFGAAGSFRYWQAWAFMGTFAGCTVVLTVYLAKYDRRLHENRISAGPQAEQEASQRIIMALVSVVFVALLVVPALDHRFGWSVVPGYMSVIGDALIVMGYIAIFFVFRANTFGASTIKVDVDQTVVSTGPYAVVRHPMYASALPILAGSPVALGSWWGLVGAVLFTGILVWRLLDEERFLSQNLPGYTDYMKKVRYRLVPFVW
jgi:protein-S-isoprenylcysteine O-methyltransferase Ste14